MFSTRVFTSSVFTVAAAVVFLGVSAAPASAVLIGGIEFPAGAASFADLVVDFSPAISGGQPTAPHLVANNALGVPDYAGDNDCTGNPSCAFVSLGDGGSIVLRFTDNSLTGSGNADFDLHIFEVGPDVEDTFVDISMNGVLWFPIGKVFGSTSSIDIDAFGFGTSDLFSYVRLTDDPNEGGQGGITVGADIDAVGAISSGAAVPEPSSLLMLCAGALSLAASRRARKR
jgi:hypothetical protein